MNPTWHCSRRNLHHRDIRLFLHLVEQLIITNAKKSRILSQLRHDVRRRKKIKATFLNSLHMRPLHTRTLGNVIQR